MSSRGEALFPQNSGTGVEPTGIVGYVDSLLLASKADLWITLHISKSPITSTSVLFKHHLKMWTPYILETLMPRPQLGSLNGIQYFAMHQLLQYLEFPVSVDGANIKRKINHCVLTFFPSGDRRSHAAAVAGSRVTST